MSDKKYTFADLAAIIARLRSDTGCPWDREQTHESLIPCMREECEEAIEGIGILRATGDPENLCEELGDVLLQIMLHSQIATEEDLFSIDDVIQGICEKMIRRHPHVFGDGQPQDAESARKTWDEIKKEEKIRKLEKARKTCRK